MRMKTISATLAVLAAVGVLATRDGLMAGGQNGKAAPAPIDSTVTRFLEQHRGSWRDLNVPEADGKALYDLVIECKAKRALEIGTSTGHSGIFIGWGLSKTGGKLITIDIDEGRHKEALQHFKEAGVAPFIDARLGDAHDLVPKVDGPLDFVFIDADKEWYTNYAKSVLPKLAVGGLMTAHNVSPYGGRRQMTGDYYEWVKAQPNLQTEFRAGVLVSKKTK
jgi:caffeoyl-CoA O-methyltransferase